MTQKKWVWVITGWDSTKKIFEAEIPKGNITDRKLEELLRTLTVKHSLTDREAIACFLKKNARAYSPVVEITHSGPPLTLMCGSNPYFVATVRGR